ncbi:cation:proton antiporter [Thiotrichales bacterium 19X7-9]|nr:cation:proton antiporter [Thiotrichales bacterium 19X7-9]
MPILIQAALYLLFATITVPIAKRLKLGSVLGYLVAGILLGPLFGIIGSEVKSVQHVAEFGIIIMMFLIGLELKPKEVWSMRYQLVGLGGLQIVLTTCLITGIITLLFNFTWNQAVAISLILALSSTAIVLQSVNETKQTNTQAGQSILSVLIMQDITVIPIFAILPMLVLNTANVIQNNTQHTSLISHLSYFMQTVIIISVILMIIIISKCFLNHLFRYIAKTKLIEIFTALTLLIVIGISIVMETIGLSAALGTFIAGVILSDSEFRHEIESQISPFKGLLMGIFFISIGASINFVLFYDYWYQILSWAILLIISKMLILMLLARIYKLKSANFWLFSLALAQGGEFAFVLLSFSLNLSLLSQLAVEMITLIVIISMILTPVLFLLYEKIILPKYQEISNEEADTIESKSDIIIAGAGRFGQISARVLNANKFDPIILDYDINMVETFRKYGNTAYYGNVLMPELLISAGIADAKVFIAAIDDRDCQTKLVSMLKRHQPNLLVIARAKDRHHIYELEEAGADFIVRETFESAALAATEALIMLGDDEETAKRKVDIFKEHDAKSLSNLKKIWLDHGEDKNYVSQVSINQNTLSELMKSELS